MRLVNLVVLLMIALMLVAGGYSAYQRHTENLEAALLREHAALAQGLANSVWKPYRDKVTAAMNLDPKELEEHTGMAVFSADVASYFGGMQIQSARLYSPAQRPLVLFNPQSAAVPTDPALLSRAAASGRPEANLVAAGYGSASVQTVVPLLRNGQVELLVALTSDASAEQAAFVGLLGAMLLGCAVIALGIYMLSHMNMRRAENMIARQYEENADLAAQAATAKEENQQKSQFLANITHELRTPLNAIIGFSDILKNEFVPAPGQGNHTNYINDIHSAGTHLLSLINDILDYSKAEAGKLELEVTEVNAVKMIQNCIRLVQPRAEIAQVRVIESLPKDQMLIVTDGKKFKQILLNLLSNAVKFTPPGGNVKVSAWLDMRDEVWVFEVRDSGIGIAPKDISRAMAPFGQVDNALSRKFEGTGLGLPLTKKFVELMGGKFSIESEPGKGTTVTFSLPKELTDRDGVTIKQVA